ncbi:MAG TPA: hypothetical protein VFQ15_10705, partial [Jiangellaceae bacterium]|nr:hypothetical protein [Jiangellaceae bacterium]
MSGRDDSGVAGADRGLQQGLSFRALTSLAQQIGERDLRDRRPILVPDVDGGTVGMFCGAFVALLGETVSEQPGGTRQLIRVTG